MINNTKVVWQESLHQKQGERSEEEALTLMSNVEDLARSSCSVLISQASPSIQVLLIIIIGVITTRVDYWGVITP